VEEYKATAIPLVVANEVGTIKTSLGSGETLVPMRLSRGFVHCGGSVFRVCNCAWNGTTIEGESPVHHARTKGMTGRKVKIA